MTVFRISLPQKNGTIQTNEKFFLYFSHFTILRIYLKCLAKDYAWCDLLTFGFTYRLLLHIISVFFSNIFQSFWWFDIELSQRFIGRAKSFYWLHVKGNKWNKFYLCFTFFFGFTRQTPPILYFVFWKENERKITIK